MTVLKILFSGSGIVYAECKKCKQAVKYPKDYPYNYCPYCGQKVKEVIYDTE